MELPPPPSGLDLSQSQVPRIYGVNISTYLLAFFAVALRFVCRKLTRVQIWWDDWLIVSALASVTVLTFTSITYMVDHGLGKHIWVGPPDAAEVWAIGLFISEIAYTPTIVAIKYSILLFYWRIFKHSNIRIPIYILTVIMTCWGIALLLISIFECFPVNAFWKRFAGISADSYQCSVNVHEFFIGNAVPNVITDIAIIALPIPFVWKLHLPVVQRIALSSIFVLGTFVAGVSIARLTFILNLDLTAPDITWNFVDTQIWTGVEAHIGILCACLPSLRPILNLILYGTVSGKSQGASSAKPPVTVTGRSKTNERTNKHFADGQENHIFTRLQGSELSDSHSWATSNLQESQELRKLDKNRINVKTDIQVSHDGTVGY